jgi:hypothetical protein
LAEIDNCSYDVAMVLDQHSYVSEFEESLQHQTQINSLKLGYDVLGEKCYFNSGVIYSNDSLNAYYLWDLWHKCWLEGVKKEVHIDQIALGKANLLCDHLIHRLQDVWNTLIYMNPIFAHQGKILHFWTFRNRSYIFCKPFLKYVKANGMNNYVQDCVLHPLKSILPFDNMLTQANICQYFKYAKQIRMQHILYAKNVDETFTDFPWPQNYSLLRRYVSIKILGKHKNDEIYFT